MCLKKKLRVIFRRCDIARNFIDHEHDLQKLVMTFVTWLDSWIICVLMTVIGGILGALRLFLKWVG